MKVSDERLIAALLSCRTNSEAAESLGIAERTLYDRMKKPEFQEKLAEAKARLLEGATASAQGRMSEAVAVMVEIMNDKQAGSQTRLNAADAVMRNSLKLTELVDVTKRVDELETMIKELDNR